MITESSFAEATDDILRKRRMEATVGVEPAIKVLSRNDETNAVSPSGCEDPEL